MVFLNIQTKALNEADDDVQASEAVVQECSVKKVFNFAKFTGKNLCQSLFFNKVKKEAGTQTFSCEFCEISKNPFFHRAPLVAASGWTLTITSIFIMSDIAAFRVTLRIEANHIKHLRWSFILPGKLAS